MKVCQTDLLQQQDIAGVYEVIRNNSVVSGETSASKLISMCYDKSWIGSFPHDRIDKMRAKYRLQVEKERDDIERRRLLREEKRIKSEKERLEREEREREEREREREEMDETKETETEDVASLRCSLDDDVALPVPPPVLSTVKSVDVGVLQKAGGELEGKYADNRQSLVMLVGGGGGVKNE
jgi:hypothetical protein